ncbi:MAG: hypothetical protein HZA78_10640 [Candidatus Schekmanbacteria bacterium]|nr:hypothetical protein [Candidatus Schekmanbacteria bacterium]
MSLNNIRTEIKALLETVPGIGKVHDFERWTIDWQKFLEFFKTADNKINGWTITRSVSTENNQSVGTNIRTHQILIKGYYGLKDAVESEKAFQNLIEAVCDVLRSHNDLNASCLKSGPPQVSKVYPRPFGGVLVHVCNIQLAVQERIQI